MLPLPCAGQSPANHPQERKTRILWIESSSTSEDLIRCTDEMVNLSGRFNVESTRGDGYVRVDLIARDGNYEPVGFDKTLAHKYDFVVLQVSAGVLLDPPVIKQAHSVIRRICDVISESGAVPVLYEHFVPDILVDNQDLSGKQDLVTELCVQAAAENKARLAPCGAVWKVAASKKGQDYLRSPDHIHANDRGNYLLACCVYAALTGDSPVGNKVNHEKYDITSKDARYFQQVTWDQYKKRTEEQKQLVLQKK